MRWAARVMRSASATEVPPNFMTTVSGMATKDRARLGGADRPPRPSVVALGRHMRDV
jgi:hypothetical protein